MNTLLRESVAPLITPSWTVDSISAITLAFQGPETEEWGVCVHAHAWGVCKKRIAFFFFF